MKSVAKTDIAVLLLFFNRSDTFQQVFEAVRQARPSKLFLYQDGPRGERDREGIEACREIASDEHIDWECEVHRMYQEKNYGCDPSEYISQKWAFSIVDKCMVLEDDDVPSQSFFPFCKEMLDRYEHDERITMIAGFNHEEQTDAPYDYLFTTAFSIWGWASWRRVFERCEVGYPVADDAFNMHQLEAYVANRHEGGKEMLKKLYKHKASGNPIYETLIWTACTLNSGLTIVPTKNLIHNTAVSEESAHFQSSLNTLPKAMQRLLTMPSHELQWPLRHPKYVIENVEYKERLYRTNGWNHPWIKIGNSLVELWLNLRYGQFRNIGKSIARRLRKWTGTYHHA